MLRIGAPLPFLVVRALRGGGRLQRQLLNKLTEGMELVKHGGGTVGEVMLPANWWGSSGKVKAFPCLPYFFLEKCAHLIISRCFEPPLRGEQVQAFLAPILCRCPIFCKVVHICAYLCIFCALFRMIEKMHLFTHIPCILCSSKKIAHILRSVWDAWKLWCVLCAYCGQKQKMSIFCAYFGLLEKKCTRFVHVLGG